MAVAIEEAQSAYAEGEIPVGAVVVRRGELLARGHNQTERAGDATRHAEIIALQEAARVVGDWRLQDAALVVTLEPCPMCVGAVILARISRLVYAAPDPRYGACGSAIDLITPELAPHLRTVEAGVREHEAATLLRGFFRELRIKNRRSHASDDRC